ncbi:MAG: PIG-L family deacetylase [Candidatus Omnitrophica bacterium]|nr:PIG-L family deacetylase [Candidatus Omnitrophota bacterium]
MRARRGPVLVCCSLMLCVGVGCQPRHTFDVSSKAEVIVRHDDRLLILAPHPDDEVLGCGGIIQKAVAMGVPLRIVFFTYGDNNQWSFLLYRRHPVILPGAIKQMGLVRHDEALAAAALLGVPKDHLAFLGYPDFGTLHIWNDHWGVEEPYQSMLTRARAVPYANAQRPGAAYKGEEVLRDLTSILREFRPTKIFVSHPADHMPDHRALYLFTRVALWDMEQEMTPQLFPYLVHFAHWPRPRGYHPTQVLEPPATLQADSVWQIHWLSPKEVAHKALALRAHRTQYAYSRRYLTAFMKPNELFGDFPVVTLRQTSAPLALSSEETQPAAEPSEELTDEERAKFVGLEARSIRLEADNVVVSIAFSRPLVEAVQSSVYLFGYRTDRLFAQMPKIHVKLWALDYGVYDQDRKLAKSSVTVSRQPKQITIRVPLDLLGRPQRLLTSARTYLGNVPLDWSSWRIMFIDDRRPSS